MAAITPLLRLLPTLLLLLHPSLREYLTLTVSRGPNGGGVDVGVGELHPVVLLAGLGCSDIEARLTEAYRPSIPRCGAMKGKGWFSLWENASDLVTHDYVQCFEEQMRLVYDPAINDYRNLPGVETRVPKFGSARGFHDKNPLHPKRCLDHVREALEALGYRDNDTLFGAPYDWRHAPPVPGQTSRAYTRYFQQFKALVEAASKKHDKKVIVFGHSYGGMVALEFVRGMPLAWRDTHVKHLVLSAPTLSAGFTHQVHSLASAGSLQVIYVPTTAASSLTTLWRSFETAIADLPSPAVFGRDDPVVVTARRNYTAGDMEDLLAAMGLGDGGVEPFRRRMVPKMRCSAPPMVPLTCINGVRNRTPRQLVFWDGDYDVAPDIVYGDGDGFVNLISMDAFEADMCQNPRQKARFKSVWVPKVGHSELVTDERAVKKVVEEILEANRV